MVVYGFAMVFLWFTRDKLSMTGPRNLQLNVIHVAFGEEPGTSQKKSGNDH